MATYKEVEERKRMQAEKERASKNAFIRWSESKAITLKNGVPVRPSVAMSITVYQFDTDIERRSSIVFSNLDKNALVCVTREKNNGLHIEVKPLYARLSHTKETASFRIEQVDATTPIDKEVVRTLFAGCNFDMALNRVKSCAKNDGSARYKVIDLTGDAVSIGKYF